MKKRLLERGLSLLLAFVMVLALAPVFTIEAEAANSSTLNYVAITSELSADYPALMKTELLKTYQTVNMTEVAADSFDANDIPASGTIFVTIDLGPDYIGTNIADSLVAGATDFDAEKNGFKADLDSILDGIYGKNPDAYVVVIGVTNPMAGLYAETDAIGLALQQDIDEANEYAKSGSKYAWKYYYSEPVSSVHNIAEQIIDANGDPSKLDADLQNTLKAMIRAALEAHPDFAYGLELLGNEDLLKEKIDKKLDEKGFSSFKNDVLVDSEKAMKEVEKALPKIVDDSLPKVVEYLAKIMNSYRILDLNKVKEIDSQKYGERVWDELLEVILPIAANRIEPAVDAALITKGFAVLGRGLILEAAVKMLNDRLANSKAPAPFYDHEKPLENFYLRFLFEEGLFAEPDAKGAEEVCAAIMNTSAATELTLKSGMPENTGDCEVEISATGQNLNSGMSVFVDGIVDADAKVTVSGNVAAINVVLPENLETEPVTHTISFGGKSISVTLTASIVVEDAEVGDLVYAAKYNSNKKMEQIVTGTVIAEDRIVLPGSVKTGEGWVVFVLDKDTYAPQCASYPVN